MKELDAKDAQRWKDLQKKAPNAAGTFFYAVKTTGIYCRAGCPSRLPKRENVEFFDHPEQAKAAGYRPCLKCRPDHQYDPGKIDPRILNACREIENALDQPSLGELADSVELSPFYFQRLFKKQIGLSPKEYAAAVRSDRVRKHLGKNRDVTDAYFEAGYGASSRFYEKSVQELGMTPTQYKKGGQGQSIRYASGESFLGPVIVAATDKGICFIAFGKSSDDLIGQLKDHFPMAEIRKAETEFSETVRRVTEYVNSPGDRFNLPLDIQGTAFQRTVWKALQDIPTGQTVSYAEVARRIGKPGAARAVGRACAANNIAVAVPCHRVVRENGDLAGYHWGRERKKALIERERDEANRSRLEREED